MTENHAVFTLYEGKYVLIHLVGNKAEHIYVYDSLVSDDTGSVFNCLTESRIDNIDKSFVRYSQNGTGFVNKDIKCGTIIPLMYKKEPYKDKKALFTDRIMIDGDFVIVTEGARYVKASSKIPEEARFDLIDAFKDITGDDHYGVIIRTLAFTETDGLKKAMEEYGRICSIIKAIHDKSAHVPQYTVLYKPLPQFIKDIMYLTTVGIEEIVTDRQDIEEAIAGSYDHISGPVNVTDRVRLRIYDDSLLSICNCYAFKAKIGEALSRKIYLKSGAYITIDETEALTASDVNSGGCVFNSEDTNETFLMINKEAAVETARQLRLRNIAGMIIIDFINMKYEKDYEALEECIKEALASDRASARFVDFTGLHLGEIIRARSGKTLYQSLKYQL